MNDLEQTPPEERSGSKDTDDEISLIDLFVVLLKYRRLILIFVILGIAVSAGFYLMQKGKGGVITQTPGVAGKYEGSMTVVINPRIGRSSMDKFPGWFNSRELFNASLKESGLTERTFDSFTITYNPYNTPNYYNGADEVNIVLKSGPGDRARAEKFFSVLLNNAELQAAAHYAQYAVDLVSWFESLRDQGQGYTAQDYIRYSWARDLLSGRDTVLKALYAPVISGNNGSGFGVSPRVLSLVIIFVFFFFAVFLAFVLNALKNIGADSEAMAKIRGALGKDTPGKDGSAKEKRDNL